MTLRWRALTQSIRDAAKVMAIIDSGVLPVGENDRLVGMITDRDIAVRAVAEGKAPIPMVRDVMSVEGLYCFADLDLDEVARSMGNAKVRRCRWSIGKSGSSGSFLSAISRAIVTPTLPAEQFHTSPSPAASIRKRSSEMQWTSPAYS